MESGSIVITNKLTGKETHLSLGEYSFKLNKERPVSLEVFNSEWELTASYDFPSSFDYKSEKVSFQLSKLKEKGDRIVATMFNLEVAAFRMYVHSYAVKNKVKFRTSVNRDGLLIIIRKR